MDKVLFKVFYRILIFLLLGVVTFLFLGCASKITGNAVGQIPNESSRNPEAYFCPVQDCSKIVENHIKLANASVYCAFYDLNLQNIMNALAGKSRSAEVKVVMDSSNYNGQIKGDGLKLDDDKQLMHNKFCVIDGKIVLSGSFNPTYNDNNYNNNNLVVIYSRILANNYEDEFNELWNGRFGQGDSVKYPMLYVNNIKIENFFCPEDNCASKIVGLVKGARSSVYFMAFSFTNDDIADALVMKDNLDLRGIFDSSQAANKFSQFKRLKEFGINVKKDSNKYKMHHKVFIIDNQTVVTGSFNPTLSADTKNDENIIIIHDEKIAAAFLSEFDRLWG